MTGATTNFRAKAAAGPSTTMPMAESVTDTAAPTSDAFAANARSVDATVTIASGLNRCKYAQEAIRVGHKRMWPIAKIHQYAILLWFIDVVS